MHGDFIEAVEDIPETRFVFGECVRCHVPVLVIERYVPNHDAWDFSRQLQPPLRSNALEYELPGLVRQSYDEALLCEQAGAWLATCVMVRRTLEAVVKNHSPAQKSLFHGLKQMRDDGIIAEEVFQWGEALRFIGNISAHPTNEIVREEDARDALRFVTAICETLYHLRPIFKELMERRGPSHSNS